MPLILWMISLVIGTAIGSSRGRTAAGFWWAFFLGPFGWIAVLVGPNLIREAAEKAAQDERRAHEEKIETLQREHLKEIRELKAIASGAPRPEILVEARYYVRVRGREIGPISKTELLELHDAGKVSAQDEVALDVPGQQRTYGMLAEEIQIIRTT